MIIENWAIVAAPMPPYLAPELTAQCLSGNVYGNPCFSDGEHITTSCISHTFDDQVITISGSAYNLGTVLPEYEAQFPNAYNRLFKVEE